MATVVQPASVADADAIISAKSCVINFCAEWCEPCGHMNMVFEELAKEHTALCFMQVDADGLPDLCDRYGLESVPAFLFFHGGALVDTLLGADAPALTSKAKQHSLTASIHSGTAPVAPAPAAPPPKPPLDERLKGLTHSSPVMVFMKGNPETPRCGFSRQFCEILAEQNVPYETFDILEDDEVRQGLKKFSDWPT